MVKTNNGLLRIFWPKNLARTTSPGVMVGWRNSESDLFVITVLEDVEVRMVDSALKMGTLFRNSPYPVARIYELCDQSALHVLGTVNSPNPPPVFDVLKICAYTQTSSSQPYIFCPNDKRISIQVVMFDPPNPAQMQHMSLEPMSLALGDDSSRSSSDSGAGFEEEAQERKRIDHLVSKIKFHTVTRHRPTQMERALPMIIRQINCAQEIADLLQKNIYLVGPRRKRSMSVSERMVESAQSLYAFAAWSLWTLFMTYVYPVLLQTFKLIIVGHRMAAEGVLRILEWPLPTRGRLFADKTRSKGDPVSLKDISACCQQIHLRLQQFSYYPIQYSLLRKRHANWSSIPNTNSDYIRFYNSLWLVANDVILGIAVGSFINENAEATSRFLDGVLSQYTVDGLKRMIRWLMSYPGGLKLNTELAAFLGDLFLWVIEHWSATTVTVISPRLPTIVYFIGFSAFAGASMPIAIFSDLLSLLTVHIYSFYIASARIFNWQLTIIGSLFHLFRGKKRNVLRNRIDNCDYDLDQLLLGTILFTVLFFLLPTVIVFYLTFASARMAIITLKASLDTWLACLNHFPLFAIMLKIKDAKRLPGGVRFKLMRTDASLLVIRDQVFQSGGISSNGDIIADEPKESSSHMESGRKSNKSSESDDYATPPDTVEVSQDDNTDGPYIPRISHISLSSTPLSLREIFEQYFQLGTRIRRHYFAPKVVFRLLTGRFVPPLGRSEMYGLQYSVLPRERIGIGEVWRCLSSEFDESSTTANPNTLAGITALKGSRKKGGAMNAGYGQYPSSKGKLNGFGYSRGYRGSGP